MEERLNELVTNLIVETLRLEHARKALKYKETDVAVAKWGLIEALESLESNFSNEFQVSKPENCVLPSQSHCVVIDWGKRVEGKLTVNCITVMPNLSVFAGES